MLQFDNCIDFSSSLCMDSGRKCSGIVPQTVPANAVNASCEIILLFWNLGSGVYVFISVSSSITAGCCGVPIRKNLNGVDFGIIVACTGLCIAKRVVDFSFLLAPLSPFFSPVYLLGVHTILVCVISLLLVGLAVRSPLILAE